MLEVLGLAAEEERVYRHLVSQPVGGVAELAAAIGISEMDAGRLLRSLESKGLLARTGPDHDRYIASPPGVALGALVIQRQDELRRAQVEMTELIGIYRGDRQRDVADVVDLVHGVDAIAQRFAQLQHAARDRVQSLLKPQAAVVTREDNDETEQSVLARGVAYQAVVERSAFEAPGYFAAVEAAVTSGVQLRVASTVPVRMLLVDREIALIPLVPEASGEQVRDALLVHPSGLLDALLALFDFVWDDAVPLGRTSAGIGEVDGDRLEAPDDTILTMLLSGLTDQTIGTQLGLSLRTVQRRVRQLMDRAGVDTRLQLGYEARKRGWL